MKILIAAGVALSAPGGVAGSGGLFLFSVEAATVNITLPAWRLDSWSEVHAPTGGQFPTQRRQVTVTDRVTGTATGSVLIGGGRYATGYVVLNHHCYLPGMTCAPPSPAPAGSQVCQPPNPGLLNIGFVLQATATCLCGERVSIRALQPGSGANLPANRVTAPTWTEPQGTVADVNNPSPITGGTDGSPAPAVTQSDIDATAASARAQLNIDLLSALLVNGGGLVHILPDGTPTMTVTSNVAAGARTGTFQVTATGTLGATEFRDSDAADMIAQGIDRWVPARYRLNGAPLVTDFQVESWDEEGNVTVSGKATDYMVPSFSVEALRSQLRGVSVDTARAMIETAVPASRVEIRLTPAASPVFPFNSARISFTLAVRAATPG